MFSANLADTYEHTEIKIPTDGEAEKNKQFLESLSTSSIIARQRSKIETFKGYLLELLTYYFLNSEKSLIKWRYRNQNLLEDDEIDIIARDKEGNLYLASCMSSYDNTKVRKLDKQSLLIHSNKSTLRKEFGTFESVEKMIFMPEDPTASQIEECKKFNVQFYSLKRLLIQNPRFSSIRKTDINRLFSQDKEVSAEDLFFDSFRHHRRFKK